jgi:CheY-like chemotaxis protein
MLPLASVLLVDDDPTTNFLPEHLLLRMGVAEQVLGAENGEQALRTLAQTCSLSVNDTCPASIYSI